MTLDEVQGIVHAQMKENDEVLSSKRWPAV